MAKENKFTEGKWETHGAKHVYVGGKKGANIASVSSPRKSTTVGYTELNTFDPDFDEACANARLISAAPDLLDVAQRFCDTIVTDKRLWQNQVNYWTGEFRKAIEKATVIK